jgi:hypothetical protein
MRDSYFEYVVSQYGLATASPQEPPRIFLEHSALGHRAAGDSPDLPDLYNLWRIVEVVRMAVVDGAPTADGCAWGGAAVEVSGG